MTTFKILIFIALTTLGAILTNIVSSYIQESSTAKNKTAIIILFVTITLITGFVINNPEAWNSLWKNSADDKLKKSESSNQSSNQTNTDIQEDTGKKHYSPDTTRTITNIHKVQSKPDTEQIIVADPEGYTYKTIRNGNLIWLAENMRTTITDEEMNFADTSDARKYGKFYSFDGANKACATLGKGWRLPTVTEYQSLFLQNDGGYTEYKTFGKNKAIGNPQNAYLYHIEGGKSGFNSLLSGYGFGTTNKIVNLALMAKYWATNISGNPDQIESNKKHYFYSFAFDKNLKEITQFEYFSWGISEHNSCRCVTE